MRRRGFFVRTFELKRAWRRFEGTLHPSSPLWLVAGAVISLAIATVAVWAAPS